MVASRVIRAALAVVCSLVLHHGAVAAGASPSTKPLSLALVEKILLTTAKDDFRGRQGAYESAVGWQQRRFQQQTDGEQQQQQQPCPYLACFGNGSAREAFSRLEKELASPRSVRRVSLGKEEGGACFLATIGSSAEATRVSNSLQDLELPSFAPFPSALKLAPSLLDLDAPHLDGEGGQQQQRLTATHGKSMRVDNAEGLNVQLSPGVLPAHDDRADVFISDLLDGLLSTSVDLHANNFWSDTALQDGKEYGHTAYPAGAVRAREWRRAADVVHELSTEGGLAPGDVCSWGGLSVHHTGHDSLLVTGLDHLLVGGRGAGGSAGAESEELQLACFMGLVSYLASRPQVLRVAPFHKAKLLNGVAKAISQSATITRTPLTDAGLDGSGEVIQVVDSGLDQESCFFRDEDGEHVEGGHYFDDVLVGPVGTLPIFAGGSFAMDLDRRKIVQYISLVRPDLVNTDPYYATPGGGVYQYFYGDGFATEAEGGHGSHTAGTAAGAMLASPEEIECGDGLELGCVGGCFDLDDLDELAMNIALDLETFCPAHGCDGRGSGRGSERCLDDGVEMLAANGGVAPGAKIAVFDVIPDDSLTVWAVLAGNGLWDAAENTGSKVHSNSWGTIDLLCRVDEFSVAFDGYMYENPEHLLIFAAGNSGDSPNTVCTIGSPAIGKNVLAVGASSSGETRFTLTNSEGEERVSALDTNAGIDVVSFFSSYGPTTDNRIKPEIVAPGDGLLSVSSSGGTGPTCELEWQSGTSMAAPVVAGAAAMIRQYFKDSQFYVTDLEARGLCPSSDSSPFQCEAFEPSAATVKAVLINSANLMGGSSEPDGNRGFGRVHLEAGLPLEGAGFRGLFVADSSNASVAEGSAVEYTFRTADGNLTADGNRTADGNEDAGEFRATLAWIDPPAQPISGSQLIHDLDLVVIAPSGNRYTMWLNGEADSTNVIERVVISADDFAAEESGTWRVSVSANVLSTDSQAFSLVVFGPFASATAVKSTMCSNGLAGIEDPVNLVCCDAACGQCGGPGCANITGLTSLGCCSGEVKASAQLCSVTGVAPCVIGLSEGDTTGAPSGAPTGAPTGVDGSRDIDIGETTPSPTDPNGDDGDGATVATPAPSPDAAADPASGNGAMLTASLPAASVYAGVLGAAMAVGGMLLP